MAKDLFHISMIGDSALIPEVIKLSVGRIVKGTLEILPVKHGGADEAGKLKQLPTGRDFVMSYGAQHPRFRVSDCLRAAEAIGLRRQSVSTAVYVAMKDGALKRVGPGLYAIASKRALAVSAQVRKGAPRKGRPNARKGKVIPPKPGGVPARIIEALRKLQNGSGEGVSLTEIKKALKDAGGISPALTDLMRRKMVVKVKPAHYRVAGE